MQLPPPALLPAGPSGLPPRTSVALIHADVEVAAKGGGVDDAIGNLVVGRGVFICGLEGRGQTGLRNRKSVGGRGGWLLSEPPFWVIQTLLACQLRLLSGSQQTHIMLGCGAILGNPGARLEAQGEEGKARPYPGEGEGLHHTWHAHLPAPSVPACISHPHRPSLTSRLG